LPASGRDDPISNQLVGEQHLISVVDVRGGAVIARDRRPWRTGRTIWTRIGRADGRPLGIAGLWSRWKSPAGSDVLSFTMLTIGGKAQLCSQVVDSKMGFSKRLGSTWRSRGGSG
jgi:hypothetical protein